jgi:hypothetical protein
MTASQIVGTGVRIFAVWLVIYVLTNAPLKWQFNISAEAESANAAIALAACLLLLIAAALWLFPLSTADKLLGRTSASMAPLPQSQPVDQVPRVAVCLLGLWIVGNAAPGAFYWLFMAYHALGPEALLSLTPKNYSNMAIAGTKLMVGIWLLSGALGIRAHIR